MLLEFLRKRPWDIHSVVPPWSDQPAIYPFVVQALERASTSLSRASISLPDENRVEEESGLRWVAGARDRVIGHHTDGSEPEHVAQMVRSALHALTDKASDDRAKLFYSLLTKYSTLAFIDALLPMIAQSKNIRTDRVQAVSRWLATQAPDREPVKAGIAIIGVVSRGDDRDLLLTLGKHEEFTLFSAIALKHSEPDPEPLLWELAQHVTGWGRVHLVERLAPTRDERIKAWLLRDGCRNDIMDEYTALICARTGDLVSALRTSNPDQPLMKGAGAILAALVRGGPAEGIERYSDGPEATERYLAHLRGRDADLDDVNVVGTIERFLADERPQSDHPARGWHAREAAIHDHVRAIKSRPDWPAKIQSGLSSSDRSLFSAAAEAAKLFGIDTWDVYFERLQRGENEWYFVMQTNDPIRIDRVVSLAEERLPLGDIATGPSSELGLGPEFQAHSALDFVLQDLRRFPGRGWPLIRTGLQSPVTRNRNMALRAIAAWDRTIWPAEVELLLRRAVKTEPEDDVRDSIRKVLEGQQLEF